VDVDLAEDQRPQFRDAQGRPVAVAPSPAAVANLGWPRIRAVNESLTIDAKTIACEWDGAPVDYGTLVGHLATVDGLRRRDRRSDQGLVKLGRGSACRGGGLETPATDPFGCR
jgi:hypothetical protein